MMSPDFRAIDLMVMGSLLYSIEISAMQGFDRGPASKVNSGLIQGS